MDRTYRLAVTDETTGETTDRRLPAPVAEALLRVVRAVVDDAPGPRAGAASPEPALTLRQRVTRHECLAVDADRRGEPGAARHHRLEAARLRSEVPR